MLFCATMGHSDATCEFGQSMSSGTKEVNYMEGFEKLQPRNDPTHTLIIWVGAVSVSPSPNTLYPEYYI